MKYFVFNADDFGMTKEYNRAVLEGYNNGFLTSASLCANGEAFLSAINEIIPECPQLGLGVHLNVIEGKALTKCPLLTDKNGNFNKSYYYFMLNSHNKELLKQIRDEFIAQIEKIRQNVAIDHIDSHVHVHGIPTIFKIVCDLATEYKIPYIRTQHEKISFVKNKKKYLTLKYPINLLKILLLNFYTGINCKTLKSYELKTNDYILGVGYTAMMDSETVETGLSVLDEDCIAEALIHPCLYAEKVCNSHSVEFAITMDKNLEDRIKRMEFEITNYKKLLK